MLWLDAFTANVDRSWRNPNLLIWHRDLWLIDHGAALYFHHSWDVAHAPARTGSPASPMTLRSRAGRSPGRRCRPPMPSWPPRVDPAVLTEVLAQVPDEWLETAPGRPDPAEVRAGYLDYLLARLADRSAWLPRQLAG